MTITAETLRNAGPYVDECSKHAVLHTVVLTLNDGEVDVIIQGLTVEPLEDGSDNLVNYERTYKVPR